ncbi:DDIT3 protein, partial [Corythaixoides concolor]|nr:DDIT3 protein [Corythaixoides concolor]
MAAQGGPAAPLPGWELDAWYQDLQEVLAAAESDGPSPPWGAAQVRGGGSSTLGGELGAELLGPGGTAGTEPAGPPGSACGRSCPPWLGTEEEDEAGAAGGRGVKRKRCGGAAASRELAKRRERANEQRVLELTAHNEQLREKIQQLSAEVERTRAALIDRMVNLRRA